MSEVTLYKDHIRTEIGSFSSICTRRSRYPGSFSSSLLLLSLELSDTQVCEPEIRALFGTASHFYEVVVSSAAFLRSGCSQTELLPISGDGS